MLRLPVRLAPLAKLITGIIWYYWHYLVLLALFSIIGIIRYYWHYLVLITIILKLKKSINPVALLCKKTATFAP